MTIDEGMRRSVGDDTNLIAEEGILKAASDYLLEPSSVQAFSSFCNTYAQHKDILPKKSQIHQIVDEMLLLAAAPEYDQNVLKIYGDDRDRLTHPYLTDITRNIYSHIENIKSDLNEPTKNAVYTDMITMFKPKNYQQELARKVRQKKIEVLTSAISYLKHPELLERYEAFQESLINNKEYQSSGKNTHKLIKDVVKIAEENFAMKELIDLSKIESHLETLKKHISMANQAKKDISRVRKDLNALENRLGDIKEILEENLENPGELVSAISDLTLELEGIESTLEIAKDYYENKKEYGEYYDRIFEDEDWTSPGELQGKLTSNFNNVKEKYQELKQQLHEQELGAQQKISQRF